MWEIIGLLLLVLAAVIGLAFLGDWLAGFDGSYTNKTTCYRKKKRDHENEKPYCNYENEKAKAAYDAAEKSLKLNMMQMQAFRQMSDVAQKHHNSSFNNWTDRNN